MQDNPRPEKVAVVDEVRRRLTDSSAAILAEYRGLSVKDISALRRALRAAGGDIKVYKNTLVRFAARDIGMDDLVPLLEGPTAIAFVDKDAASVAKALRDFAKTHPLLVVKGGVLADKILTPADANALAELPSRDVLLARLAGAFAAPMQKFAGLLGAVPRNFAYGLQALIDQRGGAPEDAAPAAADAAPAEPASSAPAAEASEPASSSPAAEASEPAASEPAASEPASSEPAVSEPGTTDAAGVPAASTDDTDDTSDTDTPTPESE
jgi:large subunit ribosomal protein L10